MSDPNNSFFSGLHVAITGVAALITSVVAVLGLAFNQGWIGGHSKSTSSSATTAPGAATTLPGDTTTTGVGTSGSTVFGSGTSAAVPHLTVEPTAVDFQPFAPTDQTVTVKNPGTAPVTLQAPFINGIDKSRFGVTEAGCSGSLDPGRTCQVKVTFIKAGGTFSAALVVQAVGGPAVEVPITAKAIL